MLFILYASLRMPFAHLQTKRCTDSVLFKTSYTSIHTGLQYLTAFTIQYEYLVRHLCHITFGLNSRNIPKIPFFVAKMTPLGFLPFLNPNINCKKWKGHIKPASMTRRNTFILSVIASLYLAKIEET